MHEWLGQQSTTGPYARALVEVPQEVEEVRDAVQLKVAGEDPPSAAELAVVLGLRIGRDVLGIVGVGPGVLDGYSILYA